MKRKDYRKPTMMVVKVQHVQMLMASGEVNATRYNYNTAQTTTWGANGAKERKSNNIWNEE